MRTNNGFDNMISRCERAYKEHWDSPVIKRKVNNVRKRLIRDVKKNTPVDEGKLRRTWMTKQEGGTIRIYNNTSYAKHVEYGHRTRDGKKFINGRYMLKKGLHNTKRAIRDEFSSVIEDLL